MRVSHSPHRLPGPIDFLLNIVLIACFSGWLITFPPSYFRIQLL